MTHPISAFLEEATDDGRPTFQLNVVEDGAITDIRQCPNLQFLRKIYNDLGIEHASIRQLRQRDVVPGGWSAVLSDFKDRLYERLKMTDPHTNVPRRTAPIGLINARLDASKANNEREERENARIAAQRALEEADAERAAGREDFTAWCDAVRSADASDPDNCLRYTMFAQRQIMADWETARNNYVEKLLKNTTYALSWSGDFVELSAAHDVAQQIDYMFRSGTSADRILKEAERELYNNSDRATSRSTSQMSNLVDDAKRIAWLKVVKRLKGRF